MRRKKNEEVKVHRRKLLVEFVGLWRDRAFLVAVIFSLTVHLALFVMWREWPGPPPKRKAAMMVARLIRPAAEDRTDDSPVAAPGETAVVPVREPSARAAAVPSNWPRGDRTARRGRLSTGGGLMGGRVLAGRSPARGGGRAALALRPGLRRARADAAPGRRRSANLVVIGQNALPAVRRNLPDIDAALAEIRRRIEARKSYPLMARRNGWEGQVLVEIEVDGRGGLEEVRLLEHSGFPLLDRATVRAVRSAAPFPPLPGKITIPVSYRLGEGP